MDPRFFLIKTKPIEICGWDGTYKGEEHYSPYYIYTAVGEVSTTDPTKNKEITYTDFSAGMRQGCNLSALLFISGTYKLI